MTEDVTLTVPAEPSQVSLARSLAAAMSARADLPLDQLEDVRLAVDEAASQLVLDAPPGTDLTCVFRLTADGLSVRLSAPSTSGRIPPTGTFSWVVLTALVDAVAAHESEGVVTLDLRVVRDVAVDA